MPDFLTIPRAAHVGGSEVGSVFVGGDNIEFAFGHGQQILPGIPTPIYGVMECRTPTDVTGHWMEVGFRIGTELTGNSAAGWSDAGNYFRLDMEYSTDLKTWALAKFEPAPTPVVNNGDGTWTYWSRCVVPLVWADVVIDFRSTSNRYGKSITSVELFGSHISLPRYPYAMPSQAALLQTDLRAAGYTGALVTSTAAAMSLNIINHYLSGSGSYVTERMTAIMSGTSVTSVLNISGTHVPLPAYPYAMPGAQATLQSHLRAAGYSGAVVKLLADEWDVLLPDRPTTYRTRGYQITITPGDPHPYWDFYGNYAGENDDTIVQGFPENVRNPGGVGLVESPKGFARLRISRGSRYNAYL